MTKSAVLCGCQADNCQRDKTSKEELSQLISNKTRSKDEDGCRLTTSRRAGGRRSPFTAFTARPAPIDKFQSYPVIAFVTAPVDTSAPSPTGVAASEPLRAHPHYALSLVHNLPHEPIRELQAF